MTGTRGRIVGVVFAALSVMAAAEAHAADWQIRPLVGFTFAGDTTFVDFEHAAAKAHATIGVNMAVLGEVVGLDVDIARTPGFFQSGDPNVLVLASSVTTVTGNLVVGLPRRFTEYVLHPYVVAGGGFMRVHEEDYFQIVEIAQTRPTFDVGAGAIGFITKRVGVMWEIRRFQTIGGEEQTGLSLGGEKLSFWRGSMAVAIRFR
jgi:hypothetical protein